MSWGDSCSSIDLISFGESEKNAISDAEMNPDAPKKSIEMRAATQAPNVGVMNEIDSVHWDMILNISNEVIISNFFSKQVYKVYKVYK